MLFLMTILFTQNEPVKNNSTNFQVTKDIKRKLGGHIIEKRGFRIQRTLYLLSIIIIIIHYYYYPFNEIFSTHIYSSEM